MKAMSTITNSSFISDAFTQTEDKEIKNERKFVKILKG